MLRPYKRTYNMSKKVTDNSMFFIFFLAPTVGTYQYAAWYKVGQCRLTLL